ncbi:MAG TPA: DUF2721 domain-containing protein [Anaerolineae bacterium]|nr:DUF2721 domain-containing protein [Anaerolineae bacterium]
MNFSISTPALLFSAIGMFMLAFTNRFHNLAMLIRQLISSYQKEPDEYTIRQIKTFKVRLKLIKYTQAFAVSSFLFCAISMFLIMLNYYLISEIIFSISLIFLIFALILALSEILESISALNIELQKIEEK